MAITSSGTNYSLALTGGTFAGTDSANVTGNGTASLNVLAASFTDVKIDDTGTGASANFNNSGANTYTSSFIVTLDSATAGAINFVGSSIFTGSATLSASTSKNVVVNSTAVVSTVNGDLSLQANQQAAPTTGNFIGVNLNGGQVKSTGSGNVTVKGRGGDNSAGSQMGVNVQAGGMISGGTAGTVTVEGRGGPSTTNLNIGVQLSGAGSVITSLGADVVVTGFGGTAATTTENKGILVTTSAAITSTGSGSITVTGTGGGGTSQQAGIEVLGSSQVASAGGNVTVTGTGGGSATGSVNRGIVVAGSVSAAGSGIVTVTAPVAPALAGTITVC